MCAELCGWKLSERKTFQGNPIYERDGVFAATVCAPRDDVRWLPNYTGSWDAIMPEVSALSETNYEVFANWLFGIVWSDGMSEREHDRAFDTASPLNRTIALILTLTK